MEDLRRRRTDSELDDLEASFRQCPRYDTPHQLTDEQIEVIIDKALEKWHENFAKGVGYKVLGGLSYLVGVTAIGLVLIAVQRGWIKP